MLRIGNGRGRGPASRQRRPSYSASKHRRAGGDRPAEDPVEWFEQKLIPLASRIAAGWAQPFKDLLVPPPNRPGEAEAGDDRPAIGLAVTTFKRDFLRP